MVELYLLPPLWGLRNISPPCMKLETWLRIAEIPYEARPASMQEAPKGKVPYIRDGATLMGDSTLILEHLKNAHGRDPDRNLSKAERAVSLAFRRMMKENLYWVISYNRWADERNWPTYKAVLMSFIAPGVSEAQQEAIVTALRAGTLEQLRGHGMGRHRPDEVYAIGIADITAVSDFLGDKPFLMGAEPTTADAAVSAYLAHVLEVPLPSAAKDHGLGLANLVEYGKRMRDRFFPEKSPG
jgi:glutathione S-transferase